MSRPKCLQCGSPCFPKTHLYLVYHRGGPQGCSQMCSQGLCALGTSVSQLVLVQGSVLHLSLFVFIYMYTVTDKNKYVVEGAKCTHYNLDVSQLKVRSIIWKGK